MVEHLRPGRGLCTTVRGQLQSDLRKQLWRCVCRWLTEPRRLFRARDGSRRFGASPVPWVTTSTKSRSSSARIRLRRQCIYRPMTTPSSRAGGAMPGIRAEAHHRSAGWHSGRLLRTDWRSAPRRGAFTAPDRGHAEAPSALPDAPSYRKAAGPACHSQRTRNQRAGLRAQAPRRTASRHRPANSSRPASRFDRNRRNAPLGSARLTFVTCRTRCVTKAASPIHATGPA